MFARALRCSGRGARFLLEVSSASARPGGAHFCKRPARSVGALFEHSLSSKAQLVLGVETSCDDTGVAVVDDAGNVVFEALASQWDTHSPFSGIVPKLARREHELNLPPLLEAAEAHIGGFENLSAVAVTAGPGLALCLKVGFTSAREIARNRNLDFLAVNHLEAHALVARLPSLETAAATEFPFLVLLVSGGHCMLVLCHDVGKYERLGSTLDDSLGEAYDKVARLLGLGFGEKSDRGGGGAALERLARDGDEFSLQLPIPMRQRHDCNFSFSGLKTSVLFSCKKLGYLGEYDDLRSEVRIASDEVSHAGISRADIAASFQRTACLHLEQRLTYAVRLCRQKVGDRLKTVVVTGGVAANAYVRSHLSGAIENMGLHAAYPPSSLCTDNGVMIAWTGQERLTRGLVDSTEPPPEGPDFRARWPL